MLGEMLSFGIVVGVAVIYRRRPEIHRPMMLLASLMIISGSLGRCPYVGEFALRPPLYVFWSHSGARGAVAGSPAGDDARS